MPSKRFGIRWCGMVALVAAVWASLAGHGVAGDGVQLTRLPAVHDAPRRLWTDSQVRPAATFYHTPPGADHRLPTAYPTESGPVFEDCDFDCVDPRDCSANDPLEAMAKFWSQVQVDGHVRVRYENSWERINRPTRNRGRLRARLAFTWVPNEEFKGGIRWTTGDRKLVLEPADRRGSALSYQDLGDVFDKFELNLDRIFITYSPAWIPNFSVTGGKFKHPVKLNPIFTDPIGDLTFDEAVQPEGIAATYEWENPGFLESVYWTVGETVVLEQSNGDEASMFFTQLWLKDSYDRFSVEASLAWYDWNNLNPDGSTRISSENNFGNQVIPVGPNPSDVIFASQFNILNPMLVVTYDDKDPCAGIHPLQFVAETFYNSESFDVHRDSGYSLGVQYGPSVIKTKRQGAWKIYYSWNEVQQESVFTAAAQDDWQRATNFRGHWIGLDYYPRDNIEVRFWILANRPIIPIDVNSHVDLVSGSRQQEWRGRFDITLYF